MFLLLACRSSLSFEVSNPSTEAVEGYQLAIPLRDAPYAELFASDGELVVTDARGEHLPHAVTAWELFEGELWVRLPRIEAGEPLRGHIRSGPQGSRGSVDEVFTKDYGGDDRLAGQWLLDGSSRELEGELPGSLRGTSLRGEESGPPSKRFSEGASLSLHLPGGFARIDPAPELELEGARSVELWMRPAQGGEGWIFAWRGRQDLASPEGPPDGLPDFAVANSFRFEGEGTTPFLDSTLYLGDDFSSALSFPTAAPYGPVIADLDGNGFQDLVLPSYTNGVDADSPSTLWMGGPDGFTPVELATVGVRAVCIEDMDQDGWLDLLMLSHHTGTQHRGAPSHLYLGGPEGFGPDPDYVLLNNGGDDCTVADLDRDGHLDIAVANNEDDLTYDIDSLIFWGSEAGWSNDRTSALPTHGAKATLAVDLDQDGWKELVFINGVDGPRRPDGKHDENNHESITSYIYRGSPQGYSEEARTEFRTDYGMSVGAVDLDADGWLDLVVAGQLSDGVTILWGKDHGQRDDGGESSLDSVFGGTGVAVGDLDGDGWPDLLHTALGEPNVENASVTVHWNSPEGFSPEAVDRFLGTMAMGAAISGSTAPMAAAARGQQPGRIGELGLRVEEGQLVASLRDRRHAEQALRTPAPQGGWHHVVFVLEPERLTLYLDGEEVDRLDGSFRLDARYDTPITLGADGDHQQSWVGELDELRVYDRALAPDEVARHAQRALYLARPPELVVLE